MANNVPISNGSGTSSVAAEEISNVKYQQIKVVDGRTSSTVGMRVNPDGSINSSIIGTPTVAFGSGTGSIIAVIQGSVAAATPANQSVYGTITSIATAGAVMGSVAALQGTNPWVITGSVQGTGSVAAFQAGTHIASVISSTPSSMLVGASIFGQLPAGTAVLGSVAALQGTNPWIVNAQNSSFIAINAGSVFAIVQSSVTGTYAEDAAHATADKGLFVLGVRNDLMASVTGADGDYSQLAVGPVGETISANAPLTKWIRGTADLRVVLGASVQAIAPQGASVFTYITGIQVANMGSASVLVTFTGGLGSILGYTIAPAGGGSNILYPNALKTGENSGFSASISGTASVIVSAQGFTAKI